MRLNTKTLTLTLLTALVVLAVTSVYFPREVFIQTVPKQKITNVGRPIFGLTSPKFNCNNFLASVDKFKVLNIAFVYNTFGNNFDCLKTLMLDPRLKRLEIHLINEPCVRNKRCGKYEFLAGISTQSYSNLLRQRDSKLKKKFDSYVYRLQDVLAGFLQPETQCFISPGLESNLYDKKAIRTLISWAKEAFPQCKMVWNPLGNRTYSTKERTYLGADYIEHHGSAPSVVPPCIVNLDGTDIEFKGVGRHAVDQYNHIKEDKLMSYITGNSFCESVYLWGAEDNGFSYAGGEPWADPRKRPFTVGRFNDLVAKYILKAQRLVKPPTLDPVWTDEEKLSLNNCKKILKANDGTKRGFVWKQSDAHPGVAILLTAAEEKVTKLTLWNKGRKIYTFFRAGTFGEDQWGNRPLWRSPDPNRLDITTLPFKSVLRGEPGGICRPIDNPKIRND